MKTNSYNIIDQDGNIFYHAVAETPEKVQEMAKEQGHDIEGLEIEEERKNVKDQLGRPFRAFIRKEM